MRKYWTIGALRSLFQAALVTAAVTIGGSASAQPAPQEGDAVWKYLATLPKVERLAALKREAAREGSLVIYSAIGQDRASVFLDLFKKENPEVKIEFLRMTTNELAQKVMTEFRASRTNLDLMMSSSDWLGLLHDALAPYQTTTWTDLDPRFRHGGVSDGWTAVDFDSLIEVIAWRTDRIAAGDAPKTLDQLADPKWKGRTGTTKVREQFLDALIELNGEPAALAKLDGLAALGNRIYPSIAGLSEGLGAGEIDIAWGLSGARAARLKQAGAPVDFVFQDPPMTLNETMAAGRLAKHPYAAALLMEFVTDVATMEASDKIEPGRVFGDTKGTFAIPLAPKIFVYRELPPDRYKELNRIVERKLIRNQ
jgi:iron(III) transport system substrate-binding protein